MKIVELVETILEFAMKQKRELERSCLIASDALCSSRIRLSYLHLLCSSVTENDRISRDIQGNCKS